MSIMTEPRYIKTLYCDDLYDHYDDGGMSIFASYDFDKIIDLILKYGIECEMPIDEDDPCFLQKVEYNGYIMAWYETMCDECVRLYKIG